MPPLPPLDGVLVGQVGGHGEREEARAVKKQSSRPRNHQVVVGRPDFLARYRDVSYVGILMR